MSAVFVSSVLMSLFSLVSDLVKPELSFTYLVWSLFKVAISFTSFPCWVWRFLILVSSAAISFLFKAPYFVNVVDVTFFNSFWSDFSYLILAFALFSLAVISLALVFSSDVRVVSFPSTVLRFDFLSASSFFYCFCKEAISEWSVEKVVESEDSSFFIFFLMSETSDDIPSTFFFNWSIKFKWSLSISVYFLIKLISLVYKSCTLSSLTDVSPNYSFNVRIEDFIEALS